MADGIIFERLGVPAASIVTDAFAGSSDAMARLQGAPGYRYAMVPHPLSSLTPAECQERARDALPAVLEILGLGDGPGPGPAEPPAASPSEAAPSPAEAAAAPVTEGQAAEARRLAERYFDQGWTDGLPVVPVTAAMAREFADYAGRDLAEEVVSIAHLGRTCTVELAAVAAGMAGCRKEHFPVLLAVAEAMRDSVSTGLLQSTTGQAQMVVVNGPARRPLGFNGATDAFGPGHRANATVGRALRLIAMNVFGIRPGVLGQSTQGTPAKHTFCVAENEEGSPWAPLHVDRGFAADDTVVTVHFARSTLHVENRSSARPDEVLATIADAMSYAGARGGGACAVAMGPEHAHLLARHGWSKERAREFLWENWGRRAGDLRRCGVLGEDMAPGAGGHIRPGETAADARDDEFVRFGESAEDILLFVAGAKNAGISTVIPVHRPRQHSTAFHSRKVALP